MEALLRILKIFGTALTLAIILTAARDIPKRAYAGCGAGVSWTIWNEMNNGQTSNTAGGKTTGTQNFSSHSEQHSDNGQDLTDDQTFNRNADGSSHGTEDIDYTDSMGNGCDSGGIPWKGKVHREEDTDDKGNRKEHTEEFTEKDGKCIKKVRDREWDSKGKLIKDTGWIETEIPCSRWNLQASTAGAAPEGAASAWDSFTVMIPLEADGNIYKGSNTGELTGKWWSGSCSGAGSQTYTYDVTGKENKFGDQDELVFSVQMSAGIMKGWNCPNPNPPYQFTDTFTLPAEDGASWNDNIGTTYTLKKQGP